MRYEQTIETPEDVCNLMQDMHYEAAQIFDTMTEEEKEAVADEFWEFFKSFHKQSKDNLARTFKRLLADYFHLTVKLKAVSVAISVKNSEAMVQEGSDTFN